MVDLILPILKNHDSKRIQRIKDLTEEIETEKGSNIKLKSGTDRKEFFGHILKVKQGDQMFRQSIISSIVSKFDKFLTDVLVVSYRQNSDWLKNPEKKISYKELLEIESLDMLKDEIISKEIDGLMSNSHREQLKFLDERLKLGIEAEFPSWAKFLEITERRNLFAHTGGIVSNQYIENCNKWEIPLNDVKEGSALSAGDDYIREAIDCFHELSIRVAQSSARRMFPESKKELDENLNNTSVELLEEERWDLAERVFGFALSIPETLRSGFEYECYFHLNWCIAKKFAAKEFLDNLHAIDWTPLHPIYHFAVAILEDRFEDAEALMRSDAVQEKVDEKSLKNWPLLRDFRKTDLFLEAFKNRFKKDFNEQLLDDVAKELEIQQDVAQQT